ncbi:DUF6055 domain-containing protein [Candidatus Sumerlaeota bacterium]
MSRMTKLGGAVAGIMVLAALLAGTCPGLEKEKSLVIEKVISMMEEGERPANIAEQVNVGQLAVAGRLDIDLHAEFMVSRTFENDTALNWYNCGVSGGGNQNKVGGNFGDFGLHVPYTERDDKYPHAVDIGEVPTVSFDGNDMMKGNFAIEAASVGNEDMALEVWVRDQQPSQGEVIFGWQAADGTGACAPLTYPKGFTGSDKWRHIVVNCAAETETWYLDGKQAQSGARKMIIPAGHRMMLGGASATQPSFAGELAAVRLHEEAMTEEEIAHNFKGGVMLGTEMHSWWRMEGPERWWAKESPHFRHCVDVKEMAEWDERGLRGFERRVPEMFELAEKVYHMYSERHAMRSSVVSNKPEFRGDGIKYKTPIQPSNGSWMGWSGDLGLGWACQGAGHINPHELVHGWQAQTGGAMQGNYWEVHANFPQTYVGVYQTVPASCVSNVCMFFPANGRDYYHDRLMFEHLAQSPEYGPMFISKLWYDSGGEQNKDSYPWLSFTQFDPDPATDLGYEWTRMAQKCVTWDYEIFGGQPADLYKRDAERNKADMMRYAHVLLERVPYDQQWWRAPKEMSPQQLGYNISQLKINASQVSFELGGYVSAERGGDWRAAFVGVNAAGEPIYGDIAGVGKKTSFNIGDAKELYLVICAIPTKILAINMTGDFRSFEQEKFPYKLKLEGCEPIDVLAPKRPATAGAPHPNGGGFVAASATVAASAYIGPGARVLGNSKVLGNARIEDYAVVDGGTVRDNAIVSGHALVSGNAVVQDYAKVRDYGRAIRGATIKDYAKVIEHGTQAQKVLAGYAVVKGVAYSNGNVRGTAMIDGSYAKGNEIDKGKWFTWSWGKGQNPGELDEEFGGIYMRMLFDDPHEWMARDDFAATWGYLVGDPVCADEAGASCLMLNGKDQFVELQDDVADMRDISIKAKVTWRGRKWFHRGDARILEFSNDNGDCAYLAASAGGKCVFAIRKDGKTQSIKGPALARGKMTEVMVILSEDMGKLFIDGKEVGRNDKMTFDPDDVEATECYLGRGRDGNFFKGLIDSLEIYSVPALDEVPATPDPAESPRQ